MQNFATKTIREIALEMPITTRVFEEFKIDYCCGGRKSIDEACAKAGVSPDVIIEKLETIFATSAKSDLDWLKTTNPGNLADYIEEKHHTFTKYELEHLPPLMEKVARVHGEHHPELLELKDQFQKLCDELDPHMQKEEIVLFPYIREVDPKYDIRKAADSPCFGSVQNPIRIMMTEHDTAGEILREMRGISKDYLVPAGACPSYTALYIRLEELERDLHQHIHLENNLLFPKAIEIESEQVV